MEGLIKTSYDIKSNIEKVDKAELEKKKKLLGSIRMIKGLTLWEVNYVEGTVVPAEFEVNEERAYDVTVKSIEQKARKKLLSKKNCIYVQALNLKVAIKKSNKILKELFGY